MAEYLREMGCGRVVRGVDVDALGGAIRELRKGYERYRTRAGDVGKRDFSQERLVAEYRALYGAVAS